MGEPVTKDTCDAIHKGVDKRLEDIERRLSGLEGKSWAIILMIIAQFVINWPKISAVAGQ